MSSAVLTWIVIFGAITIGLIMYVNERDAEAVALQRITSLNQTIGAPATICTYNPTEFGNGSAGILYIENGRIRIDIKELIYAGYSAQVDAVLNADGTRQMDPATYNRLANQGTGVVDAVNLILTKAPWKCSPWWFVNEGNFTIPDSVAF